ncbi:hypothetical protein VXS03_01755 [Photobacterium sp. S4TG1]|uniref:hypothetical protein n=1 Tax=Photobacterium sp. S4TG1 TaxID=3114587 RepID=UPI002E18180F|nr:hypothetical protein [Photobacterium sp. S4TG1]
MNKLMSVFLVLLALSGWVTGGVFLYGTKINKDYATKMAGENAFNIIEQSLHHTDSEAAILAKIALWKKDNWTAQTGSIITLCQSDRQQFRHWVTVKNISKICEQTQ